MTIKQTYLNWYVKMIKKKIQLMTEDEAERTRYIRALYDAADQIASDQINENQPPETALRNRQHLDALIARGYYVGSTEFGNASRAAVQYLEEILSNSLEENMKVRIS